MSNTSSRNAGNFDVPVSHERGTRYLRRQCVRARAYAEEYYTSALWWKRCFLALSLSSIGISFCGTIAGLVVDSSVAQYVGAASNATAAALGVILLRTNAGEEKKNSEHAGDSYSDIAERLELFDPEATSPRRMENLVRSIGKLLRSLRMKYDEPDHDRLQARKDAIRFRMRQNRENLLYLENGHNNNDDVNASGDERENERENEPAFLSYQRRDTLADIEHSIHPI